MSMNIWGLFCWPGDAEIEIENMAEQRVLTKELFERRAAVNAYALSAKFQSAVESKVVMREF